VLLLSNTLSNSNFHFLILFRSGVRIKLYYVYSCILFYINKISINKKNKNKRAGDFIVPLFIKYYSFKKFFSLSFFFFIFFPNLCFIF
jgi:hypothetical protein